VFGITVWPVQLTICSGLSAWRSISMEHLARYKWSIHKFNLILEGVCGHQHTGNEVSSLNINQRKHDHYMTSVLSGWYPANSKWSKEEGIATDHVRGKLQIMYTWWSFQVSTCDFLLQFRQQQLDYPSKNTTVNNQPLLGNNYSHSYQ